MEKGDFANAETVMARVMAATPPTAPEFAVRFLLATEAHYRRAPAEHATAAAAALREQQSVFELETTPTDVRQRYSALVAEIAGREGD